MVSTGDCEDSVNAVDWPICKRALEFVLDTQYVCSEHMKGKRFKVVRGASQLLCAGDIADAASYNKVEVSTFCNPYFIMRYGIVYYGRCRDDALIITSAPRVLGLEMICQVHRISGHFKLKVEEITEKSICMLDVCLFKGTRWRQSGISDFKHYGKPTSIYVPLSSISAHFAPVHNAWPKSMLKGIMNACNSHALREEASGLFKERLISHLGCEYVNKVLMQPTPQCNVVLYWGVQCSKPLLASNTVR